MPDTCATHTTDLDSLPYSWMMTHLDPDEGLPDTFTPDYEPDPADDVWSDDAGDSGTDYEHTRDGLIAETATPYTPVLPPQTSERDTASNPPAQHGLRPDTAYRFRRPDHALAYTRTLGIMSLLLRHEKRARRLALCGAHATVWHSPSTDTVAVRAYHCGMRCCPRCRETHSAKTREKLDRFLALVPPHRLSMITLTLKHTDAPLTDQIDRLYASFKLLRKEPCWQAAKPRGYSVLEISRSTDGLTWHPHLHLLANTPYIPDDRLKSAWLRITGDSHIVDIRRVNSAARDKHRDYLCTYLTKPATTDIINHDAILTEWIDALLHRHVLIGFGKPKLAQKPEPPEDPQDWSLIGSLGGLLAGQSRGDRRAIHWLAKLGKGPTVERRDCDAGKDYSIDLAYRTPDTPQYFT